MANLVMTMEILSVVMLVLFAKYSAQCPGVCVCSDGGLTVDCSNKGLKTIPEIGNNVTRLDLSNNKIEKLVDGQFSKLLQLTNLDLSHNAISSMDENTFSGLTKLTDLEMKNNKISSISREFKTVQDLVFLDLSSNNISIITKDAFSTNIKLTQLLLSENKLSWDVFESVNQILSLFTLNLSANPIQYLPYLAMTSLFQLKFVNLNNCSITSIDNNAFVGLLELQLLDLSNNMMTSVNREFIQPSRSLDEIDISGNPIKCSCDTMKFQDVLKAKDIRMTKQVMCSYSDELWDIASSDFTFLCTDEGPEPPSVDCFNVSISLSYKIDGDQIVLAWQPETKVRSSYRLSHRKFGGKDTIVMLSDNTTTKVIPVDSGGNYVICLRHNECTTEKCIDVSISSVVLSSTDIIVIAAAALGAIFIVLIIALICNLATKSKSKELHTTRKAHKDMNHNVPQPIRMSYISGTVPPESSYEAIPVDRQSFNYNNHGYVASDSEDGYPNATLSRYPYYRRDKTLNTPPQRITTDSGVGLSGEYLTPVTVTPKTSAFFPNHMEEQHHSCPNLLQLESSNWNEYHQYEDPDDVSSSNANKVRVFKKFNTLGRNDSQAIGNRVPGVHRSTGHLPTQQRPLPRTP